MGNFIKNKKMRNLTVKNTLSLLLITSNQHNNFGAA